MGLEGSPPSGKFQRGWKIRFAGQATFICNPLAATRVAASDCKWRCCSSNFKSHRYSNQPRTTFAQPPAAACGHLLWRPAARNRGNPGNSVTLWQPRRHCGLVSGTFYNGTFRIHCVAGLLTKTGRNGYVPHSDSKNKCGSEMVSADVKWKISQLIVRRMSSGNSKETLPAM